MMLCNYSIFVFYYYLMSSFVHCAKKGSLVFVIDDTGSMSEEIEQVKTKTFEVFDAVLSSNGSAIDDFVLVTFNDPGARLRIVTRDKHAYKREVENISIHGGGDCEEYTMAGIELALENSKPNSVIYVFTDASAKDYENFERVKSLSQKKSTQVSFLLTGVCDGYQSQDYLAFEKLAKATSGQVFNVLRDDVKKVIDYIIASIKHKKTTLGQKTFKTGDNRNMTFTVDSKVWDVMVSASSSQPKFTVLGPDENEIAMENIMYTSTTSVVALKTKPGKYTVVLNDNTDLASVVITGSTSVTFQHGFSTFKPYNINETSTKPIPDQPSYISIKLDNIDKDVTLNTVEFRDEDDDYLGELPLELMNGDQQLYITEAIDPPTLTFRIVIHGQTSTGEKITRFSPTTVEYQKPSLETLKDMPPKVSISGNATVYAEFNQPITLFCKVKGYPKPSISWKDTTGSHISSPVNEVDLPYDYVGIFEIAEVKENGTITCIANNSMGTDENHITIQIKNYFDVLEYPSDTTIEYETTEHLKLNIKSSPPVSSIYWYKDDNIINVNENYDVSDDNSTLTIKNMQPKLQGKYSVVASNSFRTKLFDFKILISGTEHPKIDKSISEYHVQSNYSVDLFCRVINGKPDPDVYWSFGQSYTDVLEKRSSSQIGEMYHIDNVSLNDSGLYTCVAHNDVGEDVHEIYLFVEFPPEIKMDEQDKIVKEGNTVLITCSVYGKPDPTVRWLQDEVNIDFKSKHTKKHLYRDNTLSFRSTAADSGVYTCEATNSLGVTRQSVRLNIFVPVKIESPKQSVIELNEGYPLELTCYADGYPQPNVKWMFFSKDPKIEPRTLKSNDIHAYKIERVKLKDEGLYTCVASNTESISNITYEVHVKVPPTIVETLPNKTINVVKGDLVLRIPCKVVGNPKPIVTWKFANGFNLVTGSEWFDVDEDGTLIIKNVDDYDAGGYICSAENSLGVDFEEYNVNVFDAPSPDGNLVTMLVEEGDSVKIECGISHQKSDLIRWFKDGKVIGEGKLELHDVKDSDSGIYSCRVSNFETSYTTHKNVIVGFKPKFTSDENTNIDFIEHFAVALSCDAIGQPQPRVQWRKMYNLINETSMVHVLFMEAKDVGQYTCEVRNEFGTISRTYNIISSKECLINIDDNYKTKQPLILSTEELYSHFLNNDRLLRTPSSLDLSLFCPNSFINIEGVKFGDHVSATCNEGSMFNINGTNVEFSKIRCNDRVVPLTRNTGVLCGHGKTELLSVGYDVGYEFMGIYDVCIDKKHKIPLYAKHYMHPMLADTDSNDEIDFIDSKHLPFKFEDFYNCYQQRNSIMSLTGKRLSTNKRCCFAKKQLVNPRYVAKGYQRVATYHHLNVIPMWGTCGTENWDEVEQRVMNLVKMLGHPLEVYTGTSHQMKLPAQPHHGTVHLRDRFGRRQPVPRYVWKVIVNNYDGDAVAIIQINIPEITPYQAFSFMLCKDICNEIEWMKNTEWRDVNKGFTFCCAIKDFETAFSYKNIFKTYELSSKALII